MGATAQVHKPASVVPSTPGLIYLSLEQAQTLAFVLLGKEILTVP